MVALWAELSSMLIWFYSGAVLMLLEFLLPGLVVVFVGLGAMTVALGLYYGWLSNPTEQLLVFFGSTLVYVFTLRIAIIRMYPSDTTKLDIDEDHATIGTVATVVEAINEYSGRIMVGDSTWQARSAPGVYFSPGQQVEICGRDNITYSVKPVTETPQQGDAQC